MEVALVLLVATALLVSSSTLVASGAARIPSSFCFVSDYLVATADTNGTLAIAEFCVCRSDQPTAVLQTAIDFSCGDGADCSAILDGGACFDPNTVASHCSWAANSYYQNNKAKGATCDFNGAATISTTDPSN
jgi:hypothetical protein